MYPEFLTKTDVFIMGWMSKHPLGEELKVQEETPILGENQLNSFAK